MDIRDSGQPTQDYVLGHFQPSLRDWSCLFTYPGLTSWATLSRPCGTEIQSGSFSRNFFSPFAFFLRQERSALRGSLLQLFKQLFAFARSEEAVGLEPMLAGVQVVVTPFERIKGGVRASL